MPLGRALFLSLSLSLSRFWRPSRGVHSLSPSPFSPLHVFLSRLSLPTSTLSFRERVLAVAMSRVIQERDNLGVYHRKRLSLSLSPSPFTLFAPPRVSARRGRDRMRGTKVCAFFSFCARGGWAYPAHTHTHTGGGGFCSAERQKGRNMWAFCARARMRVNALLVRYK